MDVREVVDPSYRELVSQIQRRTAALRGKIKAVLRSPRVHTAAEQFVRGIVDVLGKSVVGPEIQSFSEPVHEIDRTGVISPRSQRRVCGEIAEKPFCGQRLEQTVRQEVYEIRACTRGRCDGRRNRRWAKVSRERCDAPARDIGIK